MLKPAEGKKIGVVDFQKRKAGAKCLEPGVTITCPDNCFGCDPTSMAAQVTNENDGNPFPIVAECVNTKNKKRSESYLVKHFLNNSFFDFQKSKLEYFLRREWKWCP